MTIDTQEYIDTPVEDSTSESFAPGQSMSMSEALARSKGDDMAVMQSLNRDSKNAGLGDLFEYETG